MESAILSGKITKIEKDDPRGVKYVYVIEENLKRLPRSELYTPKPLSVMPMNNLDIAKGKRRYECGQV